MHPRIPESLLGKKIPLPVVLETKVHSKEPTTLGLHRMLGCNDQMPDRTVKITTYGEGYAVELHEGGVVSQLDLPLVQIVAAASYLQGHLLGGALRRIKTAGGELELQILEGTLDDAKRKIMNTMDGDTNRWPWAGVGVIPASPDGEEYAFARKDELHPRFGYCNKLALVGGGMDPNEILADWGNESDRAYTAMLRECFEEIRIIQIAREIAESVKYFHGARRASCYLYEDDGQVTHGVMRIFVARAPSNEVWDRWRKIFSKEIDGLGEANPEIVSKKDLLAAFAQDTEAARAREAYLVATAPAVVAEAELEDVKRFSRKYIKDPQEWKRIRQEALTRGELPTLRRGNFAFIAGNAGPIEATLKAEGLL